MYGQQEMFEESYLIKFGFWLSETNPHALGLGLGKGTQETKKGPHRLEITLLLINKHLLFLTSALSYFILKYAKPLFQLA